jgi:hypothetical protein
MKYMFNLADASPQYHRVEIIPSGRRPGYYLCARDGVTMVVEPGGKVRDITKEEVAADNTDSAWTQAALFGDILLYDTAPAGTPEYGQRNVVAFKVLG